MSRFSDEKVNGFLRWLVVVSVGVVVFLALNGQAGGNNLAREVRDELKNHRSQTEQSINENKANVDDHRIRNEAVHKDIERYIKCVVLTKRPFTESQIDRCAKPSKQTTDTGSDIFR